jgi:glucosamine 6-phosphate synthetase-like amidotransferase/phosphosugar isomerase protein
MCAIVGAIGEVVEGRWGERVNLLESLLLAAEEHGPHATGFVAEATPLKNGLRRNVITDKQPLKAKDFIRFSDEWRRLRHHRSPIVLAHVRWKTHGAASENVNNHPFRSKDGRFTLVHNGILANYAEIDDRYELRRDGDCDSETMLRMIEKIGDVRSGLSAILKELKGSVSVGVYDRRSSLLWLTNNGGRPMHVCQLRGHRGWIFGSTSSILRTALKRSYGDGWERSIQTLLPLAPFVLHALSPAGELYGIEPNWRSARDISLIED